MRESQFLLTDGAEVFAVDVHVTKEAAHKASAHQCNFGELDFYSDSMSPLQALNIFVPNYKEIAEIKDMVKQTTVKAHLHWVRTHVGHILNECADEFASHSLDDYSSHP